MDKLPLGPANETEQEAHTWEAREFGVPAGGWRRRAFIVIFESDTRAGRLFDLWLLAAIVASVIVVMLDSVQSISARYGEVFTVLEWVFTVFFTIEYVTRLICVRRPWRYARSFFGVVDFLAVLPTWLAFFFPGAHALIDVRLLRLLRVFRILKITAWMTEYRNLGGALWASRRKIAVFIGGVLMIVTMMGTLMYLIEGPEHGFTSIPVSIYWAITTMTTVGFGDITPHTDLGRAIASAMMLLGWGTLAVPTGIVTAEMTSRRLAASANPRICPHCGAGGHAPEARYCHACGSEMPPREGG
ncbi:MAG: ion transporter [Betaproteobacteria bacterium]|jgi:voltage-gated potassium channel